MDYTVPLQTSKDFDFRIYIYTSLIVRVNVYSTYIPTPNQERKKIKQTLTNKNTTQTQTRKAERNVQRTQ